MFITQERAKYLAEISYKLYEYRKHDDFITLKKAMELDKNTADKLISKLESELKEEEMRNKISGYGGKIYYADDEIVEVDNYKHVDYIEYDYNTNKMIVGKSESIPSINCKLVDGDSVELTELTQFYAPHIYDKLIKYKKNDNVPLISDQVMKEIYLKLLIVEDRLVNTYKISTVGYQNRVDTKYVFAMKEAIKDYSCFEEEIDILNQILKVCDGKFISAGELGGFADIGIKPTVLYLESIGETALANRLRKYEKDPFNLNFVLDLAQKGYYGLTFRGKKAKVHLF